jgi:hypothetical protein
MCSWKMTSIRIKAANDPVNRMEKNWWDLDQMKRMRPTTIISDHSFRVVWKWFVIFKLHTCFHDCKWKIERIYSLSCEVCHVCHVCQFMSFRSVMSVTLSVMLCLSCPVYTCYHFIHVSYCWQIPYLQTFVITWNWDKSPKIRCNEIHL